jgi:hypothetical protein
MRQVMRILLTAVLGSTLFMATAMARDSGKIALGRHTNYYGSAVRHQPRHGLSKFRLGAGYHAYNPHCDMGEDSKYPPWSFC